LAQLHIQRKWMDMKTNSPAERGNASQMPKRPIAVAYFKRKPVSLTNTYAESEASIFSRLRLL